MHTNTHIHTYIHIRRHTHICIHTFTSTHIHIYVYIHISIHTCIHKQVLKTINELIIGYYECPFATPLLPPYATPLLSRSGPYIEMAGAILF